MITMIGTVSIDTRAEVRMTVIRRDPVAMIVTTTSVPTGIAADVIGMTE